MLLWFAFDSIWYIVNMQHAYGICICNFRSLSSKVHEAIGQESSRPPTVKCRMLWEPRWKQKALYISEGQSANFSLIIDIWYIYAKETGGQIVFRYMIYVSLYFCNITIISSTWFEIQELLLQTVLLLLSLVHGAVVPPVPGDWWIQALEWAEWAGTEGRYFSKLSEPKNQLAESTPTFRADPKDSKRPCTFCGASVRWMEFAS